MSALEFSIAPVSPAMTRPSAFAYLRQPLRWSVWGLFNALALYLVRDLLNRGADVNYADA